MTGPEKARHIDGRITQLDTADLITAFGSPDGVHDLGTLRRFVAERMRPSAAPLPDWIERIRSTPEAESVLEKAAPLLTGVDVTGQDRGRSQRYGFHYLGWLSPGVHAWLLTGDIRYLEAFERHLDDWVAQRDSVVGEWPGLDVIWYSLGTWARCRNLLPALQVLTDSPLSNGPWGGLLATLVGGARWAYDEHDSFRHGNWQLVCATELLHLGVVLPDLKEAASWTARARERIDEHLLLDVYPDGGHYERSPGYHQMCLTALETAAAVDPEIAAHPRLAAMRQWLYEMASPAGWVPHWQDSGMVWVDGPIPPLPRSTVLPDSGYTILRGDELRVTVNHGPHIEHELESHSHRAVLDLVLEGWGRPLLWEAGGPPSYDDPEYLTWYQSGRGHNTVLVDGRELSTEREVSADPLVDTEPLAVFSGRHHGNGFPQWRSLTLVREAPGVVVVSDAAETTEHVFRACWQALEPWQQVGPLAFDTAAGLLLVEAGDPESTTVELAEGSARRPLIDQAAAEYGPLYSLQLIRRIGNFRTVLVPHESAEVPAVQVSRDGDELTIDHGDTVDQVGSSYWIRSRSGELAWAVGWRTVELPGLVRTSAAVDVVGTANSFELTCAGRCKVWVRGSVRLNGVALVASSDDDGWACFTVPYAGRWTVDRHD